MVEKIQRAAEIINESKYTIVFTGAGISVESGIPPFRGKHGIWNKYDPTYLYYDYFLKNPEISWKVIKEIFFDFMGNALPNPAHKAIAELEKRKLVDAVITQNIDNLHQEAGSETVYEFHGNTKYLRCLECYNHTFVSDVSLNELPPYCSKCGGLYKPDFIFFGELIPERASKLSYEAARKADAVLIVGTTGEVMPAAMIPHVAANNGASVIEVNTSMSTFTSKITNVFIQGSASEALPKLLDALLEIRGEKKRT